MFPDTQTLTDAGRLIHWALQPNAHPVTNAGYQQLIDRYRDQISFRECVQAICAGLSIEILAVGPLGMVLSPGDDSIFAMTPNNFRRSGSAEDRLMDGLIMVAIIATMYPRAQDLDEDPQIARPPITVDEVERTLRKFCEQLEEASRNQPDPAVQELTAGLDEAWRAYHSRVAMKTSSNGRASAGATLPMIERAFKTLREYGCVTSVVRDGKTGYRPTWKYQVMIREGSIIRLASTVRKLIASKEE